MQFRPSKILHASNDTHSERRENDLKISFNSIAVIEETVLHGSNELV